MTDDTHPTDDGSEVASPAQRTGDDGPADADVEADARGTETAPGGAADRPRSAAESGPAGGRDVREYLLKGALVMLVALGVVATLQFYLSAQTAIARLASAQFRPLFTAAFNLAVVLAVGIGIAQVVRRLG